MGVESEIFIARGDKVHLAEGGPLSKGKLAGEDVKKLDFVKIGTLGSVLFTGATSGAEYDALTEEMGNGLHNFSDDELAFPVPERLRVDVDLALRTNRFERQVETPPEPGFARREAQSGEENT